MCFLLASYQERTEGRRAVHSMAQGPQQTEAACLDGVDTATRAQLTALAAD